MSGTDPANESGCPERPRLARNIVLRPRITDALLKACGEHHVVSVIAAAGAGKTVAASQAVDVHGGPIAWLTLEALHVDGSRLCDDLAASLGAVVPGLDREVEQVRGRVAGPDELAGIIGSLAADRQPTIVIDNCHVVNASTEASAVLSSFVRRGAPAVGVVFVGRAAPPVAGLGVDVFDPSAVFGDSVLRATLDEAELILRSRDGASNAEAVLEATGGWVAGLILEGWRSSRPGRPNYDPLRDYLDREVLHGLSPDALELLVASSVFDQVDATRARALGASDPKAWFLELRSAGVPAEWALDTTAMCLTPNIRECLRSELRAGESERQLAVARRAGLAIEREGDLERAVDFYREAAAHADLDRLLPGVILELAERCEVDRAERWLAEARSDPAPAEIVLARMILASIRANGAEGFAVTEPLVRDGRLMRLVAERPAIGALACHFLLWAGQIDAAVATIDAMPSCRARDVARLGLSLATNDPEAPLPPFEGDVLDAAIARLLWSRGRLAELRAGRTDWSERSGAHALSDPPVMHRPAMLSSEFARTMVQFSSAIGRRDLATARTCVADLERDGRPLWSLICEAELAVRLEKNAAKAHAAVQRLEKEGAMSVSFIREIAGTWRGGACLLEGNAGTAATVLRGVVASMRAGDRTLILPTALVYQAEAEWHMGNEDLFDQAITNALEVARRQGSLRGLLVSLGDFPHALARHLDAEPPEVETWRSFGRALAHEHPELGRPLVAATSAHLKEFGDALIVVGGEPVRPRITKSVELLSYLLSAPTPLVPRSGILDALWNDGDSGKSRTYLRQALRRLREALPDTIMITAVDDSLRIDGAITSESLELNALVSVAASEFGSRRLNLLLEALEIVERGPFLAGSNAVPWVEKRRLEIRDVTSRIRLDVAELLIEVGQHKEALALLRNVLEIDPLLERGWRLRVMAHGLLGDEDGVVSAIRDCRAALKEIGLEPAPSTLEVARTFRR